MLKISKKTDNELIETIRKNACNDSFLALFERHKKIYYKVCSAYSRGKSGLDYQEIINDGPFVFNWAIQKFNPNKKIKFSTFLYLYSRFHCLNSIKKNNETSSFLSFDTDEMDEASNGKVFDGPFSDINSGNVLSEEVFSLLDELKDKRIKTIFKLRFYSPPEDSKWKSISNKLKLTPQRVYSLYKIGKNHLAKKIKR